MSWLMFPKGLFEQKESFIISPNQSWVESLSTPTKTIHTDCKYFDKKPIPPKKWDELIQNVSDYYAKATEKSAYFQRVPATASSILERVRVMYFKIQS